MSKTLKTVLIIVGILVLIIMVPLLYLKGTYNSLVTMDEGVKAAWAQVENQLQRRYDLNPNYVETVKGYAAHEKEVFIKVTEARSRVAGATSIGDKIGANNQLSSALARLLVVVERYPDLKADTGFRQLSNRISEIEDQIADRRELYNASVTIYNTRLDQFPDLIIARTFNFASRALWKIDPEHRQDVEVSFDHS